MSVHFEFPLKVAGGHGLQVFSGAATRAKTIYLGAIKYKLNMGHILIVI